MEPEMFLVPSSLCIQKGSLVVSFFQRFRPTYLLLECRPRKVAGRLALRLARLFTLCLLLTCMSGSALHACSLAVHSWRMVYLVNIPSGSVVLPFSMLDLLHERTAKVDGRGVAEVFWVAEHNAFSRTSVLLLQHICQAWLRGLNWDFTTPWRMVSPNESVLELARANLQQNASSSSLIFGTDRNNLNLALFVDEYSGYRCYQLVLSETSRLRVVHAQREQPWAQETSSHCWFSVIFSLHFRHSGVLSVYMYPHDNTSLMLFNNSVLVSDLLANEILQHRPLDQTASPGHAIPPLPEVANAY